MACPAQMYSWAVMENSHGLNNFCFAPQEELILKNSQSIENQRDEIDLLINAQSERLRLVLQDQKKKESTLLIKKYEHLIKQRDEDILKAASRNMDLQNHLKRMEIEIQKWRKLAHENESAIASLNSTIQRLREAAAEDAESCFLNTGDQETRKMICRCCNSRKSCVVMLPCRHLCSCKYCDAFLDSCPMCDGVKKFSIEALV